MIKFLIITDGNQSFKNEIIQPFIKYVGNNFSVDIYNDNFTTYSKIYDDLKNKASEYDYLIYNNSIGIYEDKAINLLNYLTSTNQRMKSIIYLDKFWHLPKYLKDDINLSVSNIRNSNYVISYSSEIINELKRTNLNKNSILFENLYINNTTKIECVNNKPVIGIVPNDVLDKENMKELIGIHKYIKKPNFFNNIQLVLVGFDIHGTVKDTDLDTIVKPEDTIWVNYEKIITNDYKICSPEYKDFLLKYLPNNKYIGNIDNEPYKRVWYNEANDNIINYNILLRPLVKNKYNQLNFDYESERAKRILTPRGKYIDVIKTNTLPKSKKSIMRAIIDKSLYYRQSVLFQDKKHENDFINNLNSFLI